MAGSRFRRRNERTLRPPLDVLLEDLETFRAAADAFARTQHADDEPSWPYVAAVGLERVALRWAAVTAPEPEAPWRTGPDPRLWTADRAELAASPAAPAAPGRTRPLLIGGYLDSVVFLSTSRAPGPIVVEGDEEGAERLRELITRQLADGRRAEGTELGAWWPMQVEDGAIYLLGLGLATLLAPARAQRALELSLEGSPKAEPVPIPAPRPAPAPTPVRGPIPAPVPSPAPVAPAPPPGSASVPAPGSAPIPAPAPAPIPAPVPVPVPAPTHQGSRIGPRRRSAAKEARGIDAGMEDWLRQLRATAEDVEAPDAVWATSQDATIELADRVDAPAQPRSKSQPTPEQPQHAPEPPPAPEPAPEPEPESLEDWESGFAVSSAEHAQRAE